jgi:hypothetical protein
MVEPPCTTSLARAFSISARGGQRRLDQVVGHLLQRHRVVVQDAALADLVAVPVEELDGVFARGDAVLVELHERRHRQHVEHHQAAGAQREGFRYTLVHEALPAGQPEAGKKAGHAGPAVLHGVSRLGQRGIDPRIEPEPIDQALAPATAEQPVVHAAWPLRLARAARRTRCPSRACRAQPRESRGIRASLASPDPAAREERFHRPFVPFWRRRGARQACAGA